MTVFFFARHAAVLVLLVAAAAGAGTLVAGRREPLALRCALGLAVWGEALFLLAACGWLRPVPIGVLVAVVVAGCGLRVRGAFSPEPNLPTDVQATRPPEPATRNPQLWALAVIAIGIPAFLLAIHPPLAFDETLYHMPFVRDLAETGRLRFLAHLRFPVFPQFQELLSVPVYLLAGDAATHLVPLVEVAFTAWLLATWGRRYSLHAGPLATALFLGSPIVVHLATILYVEAALMLFVTAGFYTLDAALTESRRAPLLMSGVFFGAACSVKYLGGFFAVVALVVVLLRRRRDVLPFLAAVLAAALPTTLWIAFASGNPLFPFLTSVFGDSPWALDLDVARAHPWIDALRVVWDATFARERMNQQPPVTPLLIPMLLAVAAAARRSGMSRVLLLMSAVYLAVFTFLPRDTRYLVAFLPLFSVAAAAAVAKRLPRIATLATIVAVVPGVAYLVWRLAIMGLPPATPDTRIAGYTALTRAGSSRVYVCGGEQLQYYTKGELLGDFNGLHPYREVLTSSLAERLRERDVDYFLVIKARCDVAVDSGLTLVYEDAGAQLWRVGVRLQASGTRRPIDAAVEVGIRLQALGMYRPIDAAVELASGFAGVWDASPDRRYFPEARRLKPAYRSDRRNTPNAQRPTPNAQRHRHPGVPRWRS